MYKSNITFGKIHGTGRQSFTVCFVLFFLMLSGSLFARPASPLATDQAREEFIRCVTKEPWGIELFTKLRARVDPIADNCREKPDWLTSRMSMYWKPGEYYTQCYLRNNTYDYSRYNAPMPTVRLPGMRIANNYINVPLADRQPYNESGDMLALDKRRPYLPAVSVPYKRTGDMVTQNNCEILDIAAQCALVHLATGNESYAEIAAGVFWQWLFGTYYMKPPVDETESTGSRAGTDPGGSCGYYAYEVTQDVIQIHAARLYGLLYDYLTRHPHAHLSTLGMSLPQVAGKVFTQFIATASVRGEKSGTDNLKVWQCVLPSILALEENSFYENSQGREYFLANFLSKSTTYHEALPDILRGADQDTGLKPGSPKETLELLSQMLNFTVELQTAGIDLPEEIPDVGNAFRTICMKCAPDGTIVLPGSKQSLSFPPEFWEKMLTYAMRKEDAQTGNRIAGILRELRQQKDYRRADADPDMLANLVNEPPEVKASEDAQPSVQESKPLPHDVTIEIPEKPDEAI